MYFVSHSWGTPFQHFVQCLRRHSDYTAAPDVTYWICSFANNQWDIASDIGVGVLDSAFARVLLAGVQGVVMVLDHEVQPLTRLPSASRVCSMYHATCPELVKDARCRGCL